MAAAVLVPAVMPVLPGFVDEQPSPIYAVTLTSRHRLPKIRACLDHWAGWFAQAEGVQPAAGITC